MISYRSQTEGAELINDQNKMFDYRRWTLVRNTTGSAQTSVAESVDYQEIEIYSNTGTKRLVRYWYVIDGAPRLNRYAIKLRELRNTLLGRPTSANVIGVSTFIPVDIEAAGHILDDFMAKTLR